MSAPKRQRTIHARIEDKATGWMAFMSICVMRRGIELNPTPGIVLNRDQTLLLTPEAMEAIDQRARRLGLLLQRRWWGQP